MAEETLRDWYNKNDGKGWIDCNTKGPCGRKKGEKRKKYPACRPTLAQCNNNKNKKKGPKAISWKDGRVKKKNGGFIAKGCGKVMNNRRKVTTMSQENKMFKKTKMYAAGGPVKGTKYMSKGGAAKGTKYMAMGGAAKGTKYMSKGGAAKGTKYMSKGGKV